VHFSSKTLSASCGICPSRTGTVGLSCNARDQEARIHSWRAFRAGIARRREILVHPFHSTDKSHNHVKQQQFLDLQRA
jgi:hypothetical protein